MTPLTKSSFVRRVKGLVSGAWLDANLFSGHSFRIGAATSAAQACIQESTIHARARWSSAAFLVYTGTPRDPLAES